MVVNFLRTGVGVDSLHHLYEIQSTYRHIMDDNGQACAIIETRNTPLRINDLLNGGSLYWIIKQQICARQEIIDIQTLTDEYNKKFCRILLNKEIIMTSPVAHRHIQGWRYLSPEKSPPDLCQFNPNETEKNNIDPALAKELAAAGLL